jgi:hypothetical protein
MTKKEIVEFVFSFSRALIQFGSRLVIFHSRCNYWFVQSTPNVVLIRNFVISGLIRSRDYKCASTKVPLLGGIGAQDHFRSVF